MLHKLKGSMMSMTREINTQGSPSWQSGDPPVLTNERYPNCSGERPWHSKD